MGLHDTSTDQFESSPLCISWKTTVKFFIFHCGGTSKEHTVDKKRKRSTTPLIMKARPLYCKKNKPCHVFRRHLDGVGYLMSNNFRKTALLKKNMICKLKLHC